MNTVPIIRKGSIKDYCSNGFGGGMVIGIMVFLAALINNSIITSLLHGLFAWIAIFILFIGIGFTSEEYYKRKKRIRELNSVKYSFLDDHHFILHQDLFFEGVYKGFWFRVIPMTKWQKKGKELKYDVIESFYNFEPGQHDDEKEIKMSGDYAVGKLCFSNHCAGFIPKDWEDPDFKENFDGLISVFGRENLKPMSKKEWEESYGKQLETGRINEEKSRTKQILKIGKLDIKYIKQDKRAGR